MKVLVLGANGATGFRVTAQALQTGISVKAMVRNTGRLAALNGDERLEIIRQSILDAGDTEMGRCLSDVGAVVCCLGHNLTFKGIFGKPHDLVTEALRKVTRVIGQSTRTDKIRIVLMNTTGCVNKGIGEKPGFGESVVLGILGRVLPPQRDNEMALAWLVDNIGRSHPRIEWVAVRPDTLFEEASVSEYTLTPSPVRSPVFNAGKTSRINVADFMVRLLSDDRLWETWKFGTPVIYNIISE